jgi:cytoskeletal protein RodZ
MKLLNQLTLLILLVVAISSCSVNNSFIQKRKYQKGYHLSMKKKINNSDNSKRKDNQLEQKNELAKENSFSNASEESNGIVIQTANITEANSNEATIENVAEKEVENNAKEETAGHINTRGLAEQIKTVVDNKLIIKSNTVSKTSILDNSELINIILIVILVLLILALIGKILPGLSWLLGVIILMLLIYLVLILLDVV